MPLVLNSGEKKSSISSNAAPVKQVVKAWELERFKQQKSKLLWAKSKASLAFFPTSEASTDAHLIFHSIVHPAAVVKTALSQSSENATLLFQMTLIQIKSLGTVNVQVNF